MKNKEGRQDDKKFLTSTGVLIGILELCVPREEFEPRITATVETSLDILACSIRSTVYTKGWFTFINIWNTKEEFGHSLDKHLRGI